MGKHNAARLEPRAGAITVDSERAATDLARGLQREGRERAAVVITTAAGAPEPFVDVEAVAEAVDGLCDVYVIPTGPVSWAFSRGLPDGRQVYGGASRVYPVDLEWLRDMRASPLRFAYGKADRERVTRTLIGDAMAAVHVQGDSLSVRSSAVAARPAHGTAQSIVGGRCWVALADGGLAIVWPELVAPGVPAERLFASGMDLHGLLNPETRVLDVTQMLDGLDPQRGVRPGDLVLGLVQRVARDTCAVTLVPGTTVTVSPFDAAGDATADLREVLSEGEVVALELTELDASRRRGRIVSDVDLDMVPALSLLPGGPGWLVPPEPLSAEEPATEDEELVVLPQDVTETGDELLDATRIENEQLRKRLENLERKLDRLTRERDEARASARRARERAGVAERRAAADFGDRVPLGEMFADPLDAFRFDVHNAWATRTTADDKKRYPWREFAVGAGFLESLGAVEGVDGSRVAEVVADIVCGRADSMHVYEAHQLRTGSAGGAPPVVREGGETCWRIALQRNTPAARRLHYWRRADGSVELSSIRVHDDFRP
jgi:hypothetical protein